MLVRAGSIDISTRSLRSVVRGPVLVDLVGDEEVFPFERRHERVLRLLHGDADLFGPRMPRERRPEQFLELGPVPVGGDRKMQAHGSAAVVEEIQEALTQHLFDLFGVGPVLFQGRFFHVRGRRRDPRSGGVVQDDRIELLDLLGREHNDVVADHGRKGPALLAEGLHRLFAVRDAVALVRVLVHEVGRRIPDQHGARFFRRDARLHLLRRLADLGGVVRMNLGPGRRRQAHHRAGNKARKEIRVLMVQAPLQGNNWLRE